MNAKALYFAVVDYEEAPQVFQQVRLRATANFTLSLQMNLNTAPVIYHFPAKGARKKSDQMDFQRLGIDADAMSKFVTDRTEIHVGIRKNELLEKIEL